MKHIVIGATGAVGSALVDQLSKSKDFVMAISRSTENSVVDNVENKKMDILDPQELASDVSPGDIVYYTINSPYHLWEDLDSKLDSTINALAGKDIKFVYIDNTYCYSPGLSILNENSPDNPATKKGIIRKRLSDKLMKAHEKGLLKVSIARSSDFYGPGVERATLGKFAVQSLLKKGKASVPVNVDVPHCFHFVKDIAANLIMLSESDKAWGRVWHLPCDRPIAISEWGSIFLKYIGKRGGIKKMSPFMQMVLGWVAPPIKEYKELQYEYDNPLVLNSDRFRNEFEDAVVTPHEIAIRYTVDHLYARS